MRLWDAGTGEHKATLTGHTNWVKSVTYSPDGSTLATGSNDNTVRLWDARTGACTSVITGHTGSVLSVKYSPDGETLSTGSADRTVKVWRVSDGLLLWTSAGGSLNLDKVQIQDAVGISPQNLALLRQRGAEGEARALEDTGVAESKTALRDALTALFLANYRIISPQLGLPTQLGGHMPTADLSTLEQKAQAYGLQVKYVDYELIGEKTYEAHIWLHGKTLYITTKMAKLLDIALSKGFLPPTLIDEILKHESLESTGMSHDEVMREAAPELNKFIELLPILEELYDSRVIGENFSVSKLSTVRNIRRSLENGYFYEEKELIGGMRVLLKKDIEGNLVDIEILKSPTLDFEMFEKVLGENRLVQAIQKLRDEGMDRLELYRKILKPIIENISSIDKLKNLFIIYGIRKEDMRDFDIIQLRNINLAV